MRSTNPGRRPPASPQSCPGPKPVLRLTCVAVTAAITTTAVGSGLAARIAELSPENLSCLRSAAAEAGISDHLLVVIAAGQPATRSAIESKFAPEILARYRERLAGVGAIDSSRLADAEAAIEPLLAPSALLLQEARLHYRDDRYRDSGERFEEAFAAGAGGRDDYYSAACAWALAGEPDPAFRNLDRAVGSGWLALELTEADADLLALHDDPRWTEITARIGAELDRQVALLPDAQEPLVTFDLPEPSRRGDVSVEEALDRRRSIRNYADAPLTLTELSQLLWAAYGVNKPVPGGPEFLRGGLKTAPSAGALYPLELYAVVGEVDGLEAGVYRYQPEDHRLVLISRGDHRADLADAALGQPWILKAPVSIVYSAVFARTTGKYGPRGRERYVPMDVGHSGQNVYLQCAALGLGTVSVGAFLDPNVKLAVGMTRSEEPLYVMPVGRLSKSD